MSNLIRLHKFHFFWLCSDSCSSWEEEDFAFLRKVMGDNNVVTLPNPFSLPLYVERWAWLTTDNGPHQVVPPCKQQSLLGAQIFIDEATTESPEDSDSSSILSATCD